MCDQTEVSYEPGNVVWVKLGPVWWPGQVQDYEKLPEEITESLRKKPIAVVKFFQEETFEYVKNLNQIYHYNCRKKEEFIKKGLDMVRNSNFREVPSNMKMFPNDIVMAEHLTGGDPNILDDETFAPEQKQNYSDLFGAKKSTGKKVKAESFKKDREGWKSRKRSGSPFNHGRRSLPTLPSSIPRPITHPRFITKALEGRSDHEVRIRCQLTSTRDDLDSPPDDKKYKCHLCDFQSSRLNVIVLHNKSHSAGFIEAQNASKARLKFKERERISPVSNSLSEQTPTTVTSRGRVKSLPKKLLDYTDEPLPKMFKERVFSSKPVKEETPENLNKSSTEKSTSKTPKKKKEDTEKSIKRPLFGKRKTAKEKAELAKKLKQENEAMKETLLKDWDDDDVNQEEVELERLKQALESTTSSGEFDDDSISENENELSKDTPEKTPDKVVEKLITVDKKKVEAKKEVKSDIKTKVFEFDDSEDSLPVTINFRLKNQREKFTDDKFKKPKPPKPLSKVSKPKQSVSNLPTSEKKEVDKETAEFNEAFNTLLEETVVPVLPEIPKTGPAIKASSDQISDQTSDISSSTDLLEVSESIAMSSDPKSKDVMDYSPDSEIINNDLKMECTSSDTEEVKSTEPITLCNIEETEMSKDQKNSEEVSASDPRVEMDRDLLMSGVATTTTNDLKSSGFETPMVTEGFRISEDLAATEISSTCDVAKSYKEEPKVKSMAINDFMMEEDFSHQTKLKNEKSEGATDSVSDIKNSNIEELSLNTDVMKHESSMNDTAETQKMKFTSGLGGIEQVQEAFKDALPESLQNDPEPTTAKSEDLFVQSATSEEVIESISTEVVTSGTVNSGDSAIVSDFVNEETVTLLNHPSEVVKEEIIQQTTMETEQSNSRHDTSTLPQITPVSNMVNVQLLMPETETNTIQISAQPQSIEAIQTIVPNMSESCKLENQNISQDLQDMELDINSMPVIIGGEDFIQPEPLKQNFVPIQPKYSESIVISPKGGASSPNKPESVIMHLGEPSTSNQSLQSIIAIPSKGGRGRGGRSQKSTSKAIKLSASALKNLGNLQKGGNQQVLILKTANGQDKQDKGGVQKNKGPLNMIQHGNKILIINNQQIKNQIKLNPQQQQLLTGGKLAPGTRVIASKVIATTTSQGSASTSKASISRSSSKPTQKIVISKGGILSNTSKSVIINNSTGKLMTTVPGTHTITTSKGQTLITHNILNTKGGLIIPSSSQNVSASGKTATIITSQALSTSKGMILAPITSKGGTILSGNPKLRIVTSKAPLSGTKMIVQNSQGKIQLDPQHKGQPVKIISSIRGQPTGNTILIQTSQGIVAKSIASSTTTTATSQPVIRAVQKTVMTTIPTQTKIRVTTAPVQQPQIIKQPQVVKPPPAVKKVTVQKVRQSPNILQKTQRKSTPRTPKASANRLISPAVSSAEPIILSTTSSLPVIAQPSLVQGQVPQNPDGLVYLTVDESGNYRQIDNKSLLTFDGNTAESPRTIFIPASSQPQDVSNIFLAIDDAGNIVNISQPAPSTSFTTENTAPSQDILAKALANTQVLQQETIIPDIDVTSALSSSMDSTVLANSSFSDQAHYPPSLSHSVLETSLTLNQPIMTPLEVPSAVSPNLGQISSLPSNYITSNLLTPKQKHIRPSMPLLTEETLANQARGEVFLLDSSNNIIPASSGSQISFQLTLDDNNVIVSSEGGSAVLPQTYQVVSSDLLTSQLVSPKETQKVENIGSEPIENQEKITFEPGENVTFNILPHADEMSSEGAQTSQHSIILREALESPQTSLKSEHFLSNVDTQQGNSLASSGASDQQELVPENSQFVENHPEQIVESFESQDVKSMVVEEEVQHSLKRKLGEEETVTSSSDLDDVTKRVRIDER